MKFNWMAGVFLCSTMTYSAFGGVVPKGRYQCHSFDHSTGEYEIPFVVLDATKARESAVPIKENILQYTQRMSELNPGFPTGKGLNLVKEPPVGCAPTLSRFNKERLKCLIDYDGSYQFWFSFEISDQSGNVRGDLCYESVYGGPGGCTTLLCSKL